MVPVNANYVITSDQTVKDAILKISINLARCVIVTRDSSIVIGVVSEGDIVRALTDDISVYTSITKIMRPSFKYLNESSLECALKLVQEQPGITLIPVVRPTVRSSVSLNLYVALTFPLVLCVSKL